MKQLETYTIDYRGIELTIIGYYKEAKFPIYDVVDGNNVIGHPEEFEMVHVIHKTIDIKDLLDVLGDDFQLEELENIILNGRKT